MVSTERLVKTLGGQATLKRRITTLEDLQQTIQSGLPYHALEAVMERFGLARAEVETVLGVPTRTMARRKRSRQLSPDESDRLLRLARLAAQAVQVFGTEDRAATWLHRPNRALRRRAPMDLLRTDLGAKQVEEVLGRIEHGVIS